MKQYLRRAMAPTTVATWASYQKQPQSLTTAGCHRPHPYPCQKSMQVSAACFAAPYKGKYSSVTVGTKELQLQRCFWEGRVSHWWCLYRQQIRGSLHLKLCPGQQGPCLTPSRVSRTSTSCSRSAPLWVDWAGAGVGEHTISGNKVSSDLTLRASALAPWGLLAAH